jgi:hypothetical protein
MLQKKKKKKKKREKEGPNKRTARQTGLKKVPTLAILLRFERNKKRGGRQIF